MFLVRHGESYPFITLDAHPLLYGEDFAFAETVGWPDHIGCFWTDNVVLHGVYDATKRGLRRGLRHGHVLRCEFKYHVLLA